MIRSQPFSRSPALILALLAVLGLLNGVNPPPVAADVVLAGFDVPLCRTGLDHKRPTDHPTGPCESCLLCTALYGHSPGTPVIPAATALPPLSVARLRRSKPAIATTVWDHAPNGPWARAPPGAV
jgi:hypothetical protein